MTFHRKETNIPFKLSPHTLSLLTTSGIYGFLDGFQSHFDFNLRGQVCLLYLLLQSHLFDSSTLHLWLIIIPHIAVHERFLG